MQRAQTLLVALLATTVAWSQQRQSPRPPLDGPTLTVPGVVAKNTLKIVAYGDTRFTDVENDRDTAPKVRQYLVKQIAKERPDAILMTGDLPFHGADPADWLVYRDEAVAWTRANLRVYPTLGNHDVLGGWDAGVRNFNATFPELKGYLYYSVQIGNVYVITLDCTESYADGSPQRAWLAAQLDHLPTSVNFVFFVSHMPLYADVQSQIVASMPNPPELSLRQFILSKAPDTDAKLIVINGHLHNYERFESKGISYIVSGGGGATPYRILVRGPEDLFRAGTFPNYHYLVFAIHGRTADVTMYRVTNPTHPSKLSLEVKDRFTLTAPGR
ncbi:MAG: metallophosphoesterase [Silvibacterium sp.]|nr:metallophosphoesterase [Silvibacterium sp.]